MQGAFAFVAIVPSCPFRSRSHNWRARAPARQATWTKCIPRRPHHNLKNVDLDLRVTGAVVMPGFRAPAVVARFLHLRRPASLRRVAVGVRP